jgi:hypothetical protein
MAKAHRSSSLAGTLQTLVSPVTQKPKPSLVPVEMGEDGSLVAGQGADVNLCRFRVVGQFDLRFCNIGTTRVVRGVFLLSCIITTLAVVKLTIGRAKELAEFRVMNLAESVPISHAPEQIHSHRPFQNSLCRRLCGEGITRKVHSIGGSW